jgi:lysophospholipase L1-like esterase
MKKTQNAIANASLVLASTLFALLILEVAVRVLHVPPEPLAPLQIPLYRLSGDPVIGYEYRPGYASSAKPARSSQVGFVINRIGFRDYEYKESKPVGTYRIIVLGDSTTAGNSVPDLAKTYTKRLEVLLNNDKKARMHYEVMNMGVGGYQTMQEVETLRTRGLIFHPDLVLVTFCINDFDLHSDGGVYDKLRKANHISMGNPGTDTLYSGLLKHSRLAFILYHRFNSSKSEHEEWYVKNVLKGQSTVMSGLTLLSKLQQANGFSAAVVILPGFRTPFHEYRYGNIHQRVFQAAEDIGGIKVYDLLPRFMENDDNASKFSHDFIHMNEHGHEVMAEILLPIVKNYVAASESRNSKQQIKQAPR